MMPASGGAGGLGDSCRQPTRLATSDTTSSRGVRRRGRWLTRPEPTGIPGGGNHSPGVVIQSLGVPTVAHTIPVEVVMSVPLLIAVSLALQGPTRLDSAEVARVLGLLKVSDSVVCDLAGQSLTNYGDFWVRDFSYTSMPMPRPMPTPMPMPGGGGAVAGIMGDVMLGDHGHRHGIDTATLGAFRAVLRDDN